MSHKTTLFALIFVGPIFFSCKTVCFQKYFPINENSEDPYLCVVDSTHSEYTDTLICRAAITRRERFFMRDRLRLFDTVKRNSSIIKRSRLYVCYFEKLILDSAASIDMIDKSFAERLYCFYKGKLYVGWGWGKNMRDWLDLNLLFPKRLRRGVDYTHKNGDYWKSFEYLGKETIKIGERTYSDCLKIDIFETLGGSKKIGTVWLAKHIGLIKWEKKDERVKYIYLDPPKSKPLANPIYPPGRP